MNECFDNKCKRRVSNISSDYAYPLRCYPIYLLRFPHLSSLSSNYVSNIQQAIARQTEAVFHNLHFTIVFLELFGLIFLICKLFLVPLFRAIHERLHRFFTKVRVGVMKTDKNMATATEMNYLQQSYE
jgi:hypothetical protein